VHCVSVFDEQGRFALKFDDSDIQIPDAGLVVEAIGQAADHAFLGEPLPESLEWSRNRIQIDVDGAPRSPGCGRQGMRCRDRT
jgi:glutamate synthase (NADPH/NADH) small chain